MRMLYCILAFLILPSSGYSRFGFGPDKMPKSNAEIFREGVVELVHSLAKQSGITQGGSIVVSIVHPDENSLVKQAVTSSLQQNGYTVYDDSAKATAINYNLNVNDAELMVSYGETYHETILGESRTSRTLSVNLPYTLTEKQTGKVIRSETMNFLTTDTVSTDMIPLLEHQQPAGTKSVLPARSFLDRLVEPLVIIAATGVAIYLFFHVRS